MSVTVSVMVQKNHGAENSSLTTGSFESLMEARDGARQMKKEASDKNAAIEITVPQGRHEIDMPLQLKPEDSGSETAPVTWKAEQGAEVILSGGHLLENAEAVQDKAIFKHLTAEARLRVVQFDLKDEGVPDFGHATASGERPELFIDGDPMPLAGWPNDGFTTVKDVLGIEPFDVRGTRGDRVGKFVYRESRPERWQDEADPWLHGYWFWDWSDEYQQIASIDTDRKIIELEKPYHNYGYRPGMRYRAVNMLCELDSPGEWYIDRDKGILYLWPPRPIESSEVVLSASPGLLEMNGISHVRLEGLTFEATRECPLTILESEDVEVKNCEIRNVGGDGVIVKGGADNAIVGCHIRNPGRGGITLQGGDRPSLTHANHRAEDNHIHHFSRVDRTYTPAVNVSGVGHTVRGNLIHHAPHNGIQLSGNEHVIEDNELHHLCQETGDVGAFYAGRDWTERGTVLQGNFFHHIAGPGQVGAMGVYLDDAVSGFTVRGNVFWKVTRAAFIGGGRDNIFENNIFIDCGRAIHVDARGMNWMSYHVKPGGTLPERLEKMPVDQLPWRERYPELVELMDEEPAAPKGNRISRNVLIGEKWNDISDVARPYLEFKDNLIEPGWIPVLSSNFTSDSDLTGWSWDAGEPVIGSDGLRITGENSLVSEKTCRLPLRISYCAKSETPGDFSAFVGDSWQDGLLLQYGGLGNTVSRVLARGDEILRTDATIEPGEWQEVSWRVTPEYLTLKIEGHERLRLAYEPEIGIEQAVPIGLYFHEPALLRDVRVESYEPVERTKELLGATEPKEEFWVFLRKKCQDLAEKLTSETND